MADPIRAELEALIASYDEHGGMWPDHHVQALFAAVQRARAALAAEPAFAASEPSDEDLADLSEVFNGDPLPAMRRALELWGRPTIAALAAEPPAPAEHVATLHVSDFRGYENYNFQHLVNLPPGHYKLFTACTTQPPAPAPAADAGECTWIGRDGQSISEREWLADWIENEAPFEYSSPNFARAAALLRQLPPEGLLAVEYVHIDSGARIICEPNEECSGRHWAVLNSRHFNPCTEFRTVADAVAALQQPPQGGEAGQ